MTTYSLPLYPRTSPSKFPIFPLFTRIFWLNSNQLNPLSAPAVRGQMLRGSRIAALIGELKSRSTIPRGTPRHPFPLPTHQLTQLTRKHPIRPNSSSSQPIQQIKNAQPIQTRAPYQGSNRTDQFSHQLIQYDRRSTTPHIKSETQPLPMRRMK